MKIHLQTWLALALLLVAYSTISEASGSPATNWVVQQFHEVDTLLANPGQGWMSQSHSPRTSPRFPCSVVYIRFNWADVEPERGKFNWHIIDDVIAAWKPRGATVAFRVMTCNAHSAGYRPYALQFTLIDSSGKVCFRTDGKADPSQWLPGEHPVSESLRLPVTIESGQYTLTVGVMDPTGQRRPFRLAIDAPESDGHYSVSRLTIE